MPRILVLDDEPLICLMLLDWLSELGCETVGPANSVQGALTLIKHSLPDAALLDLSIGDEGSYQVAAALRAKHIPFAFATGYGEKSVASPFDDELVVPKPFDFQAISVAVAILLHGRAPSAADQSAEAHLSVS